MTAVTPSDRPKSVRNRCVNEVFGGVYYVVTWLFGFSVGVGAFVIGLSQISSCFSFNGFTLRNNFLLHFNRCTLSLQARENDSVVFFS